MSIKGIDVSVHNGNIDWNRVKSAGINFAILRAGYGKVASQKDAKFEQNYTGAKAAGIPVGAYWYSYAMNEDEARLEADVFLSVIKGKQFEMPVYYDVEEHKQFTLGKDKVSAIMRAFMQRVEAAGYLVGLYSNKSSLISYTSDDIKEHYAIWLAHWVLKTDYSDVYGMWQYSDKGHVDGIVGNVDMDTCYVDYTSIIKNGGYNGFNKPTNITTEGPSAPPLTENVNAGAFVQEVIHGLLENEALLNVINIEVKARAVLHGLYGNGDERKRRLGADYEAVQNRVNDILKG